MAIFFAAPDPATIYEGIRACDGGRGVILLYNNYAGDVLNFNMAQEMARDDGILVETVLINDENLRVFLLNRWTSGAEQRPIT